MSRTNWDYMSIYVVRATRIDQLARCSVTRSGCTQTKTQIESQTEVDDQRDPRRLVSFDRASTAHVAFPRFVGLGQGGCISERGARMNTTP